MISGLEDRKELSSVKGQFKFRDQFVPCGPWDPCTSAIRVSSAIMPVRFGERLSELPEVNGITAQGPQ